jgi:hypothetical protein
MYVSSLRKRDKTFIEIEVDGNHLPQPREVAEAFAEYFRTSCNNAYVGEPSSASRSADSLSLFYVPESDMLKAKRRIRVKNLLDYNDIPACIIKVV